MDSATTPPPVGQQVSLPGHFDVPVVLEGVRPLAKGFECRVRLPVGTLEEPVITDEAHKCSAYTKKSNTRGDEAEKAKRYQLAEHLTAQPAGHVLLLTATPHHGDDDRFAHFIRLLDPDLFPEPRRNPAKAGELRRDILGLGPDCPWALRRLKEDLKDLQGRRLFPGRHAHTISIARHGPVRHVGTALVVPATDASKAAIADLLDDLDPEITRQSEIAAENIVVAYETARGWEPERVGHLKTGFDVRSLGPADPQTGYRDPVTSIRRIEVKGRKRGQTIRLTTNEWYKAVSTSPPRWLKRRR